MKQLSCEMCGSTDIIKQDGVFVCQSCGMKYSVEEAKKMMVEVEGTVKVDNSEKLKNLYQTARRYRDQDNSENAAKYYDMILAEDPNSWEALFYSVYFTAKGCTIAGITSAAINVTNCLDDVYRLIEENEAPADALRYSTEVHNKCSELSELFQVAAKNHYKDIDFEIRYQYEGEYNARKSAASGLRIHSVKLWSSIHDRIKKEEADKIAAASAEESFDDVLAKAFDARGRGERYMANALIDLLISRFPNSPVPLIAKAVVDGKLSYLKTAAQFSMTEDDKKRLNTFADSIKPLLVDAASQYDYDAVKYLLDLGVDANYTYGENSPSALWNVSAKTIAESSKLEAATKIAKILLDSGADINVEYINIALYNDKTPEPIAKLILEKYPDAKKGKAPSSGGCYVATAVYGSYDCPQVWTLRRYRDYTLAETWYGRAFIHTYYAVSPTLVKWFGDTQWFKNMWKPKLDRMVEDLRAEGVEDTPYEDKAW